MKFEVENLGAIKKGEFEIGELTIFTGSNNAGKTYITLLISGLYNHISRNFFKLNKDEIDFFVKNKYLKLSLSDLMGKLNNNIKKLTDEFYKNLGKFYSYDDKFFKNTIIDFKISDNFIKDVKSNLCKNENFAKNESEINEDELIKIYIENDYLYISHSMKEEVPYFVVESILSGILIKNSFVFPSVREGLNLFKNELNINRTVLIDEIMSSNSNKPLNPIKLMDKMLSKYPRPISEYIQFINSVEGGRKEVKNKNFVDSVVDIAGGSYTYENTQIYFKPKGKSSPKLPLHMASSTARAMAGIYFWFKYEEEYDFLVFDEPELNLHPDNQRKMAKLICEIVNSGTKVIISTHSPFIITEINNMTMLKDSKLSKTMKKKMGYTEIHELDIKKIQPYLINSNTIEKLNFKKDGIDMGLFNEAIDSMNQNNNKLYYSLGD